MIDLSKHIRSLLPPLLRSPRMTTLMGVLLAPLKETAKNFEQAAAETGYRLYADGSIISLTHHIKRALGVDVKIVNTPGKEVDGDFRVMLNTDGTDPERVRDFVERYKIAGKRFVV
ncbi:MAG: hypothetical protein LBL07_18635 [Tannerella sp.]|jgi:hypothetical protein|nr:hypothetical protein [Tannerella sp.]